MKVRIQMLTSFKEVKDTLQKDGWKFVCQEDDGFWVRHPYVPSEASARVRLYRLGLLTSTAVRIEFKGPESGMSNEESAIRNQEPGVTIPQA